MHCHFSIFIWGRKFFNTICFIFSWRCVFFWGNFGEFCAGLCWTVKNALWFNFLGRNFAVCGNFFRWAAHMIIFLMGPATTPMNFFYLSAAKDLSYIKFLPFVEFLFRAELNCLKLNWWAGSMNIKLFIWWKLTANGLFYEERKKAHSANAIFRILAGDGAGEY